MVVKNYLIVSDIVVLFPIIYLNYLKYFIIVYTNVKIDFQ